MSLQLQPIPCVYIGFYTLRDAIGRQQSVIKQVRVTLRQTHETSVQAGSRTILQMELTFGVCLDVAR